MTLSVNDLLVWLLLPLSGNPNHELSFWASMHGRVMVVCWGVLLPLGAFIARFFKVTPSQNWPVVLDTKVWWKAHLHGQSIAIALAAVGVALIWNTAQGATQLARWHGYMGWTVMAFAAIQAIAGVARGSKGGPLEKVVRGDHYDMTKRRNTFEKIHKSLGYTALLLALSTLFMGLAVADAPRWMVLIISAWCLVLFAGFVWLQKRGYCMDTYQAIWGPDEIHPGNRVAPIGWGVSRYSASSFAKKFRKTKETT